MSDYSEEKLAHMTPREAHNVRVYFEQLNAKITELESQLQTVKHNRDELKKNKLQFGHIQEENKKLRAEVKEDREYGRQYDHFRKYEHAPLVKVNTNLNLKLEKYGQHFPACVKVLARLRDEDAPCSCGFDETENNGH